MKNWPAITLFTLAFLPAAAHAAEYVVSAENGNDSNPGTANPYSPWKTLQKAADIAGAGDRVRVEKGTYSGRVVIKNSGAIFEGVPGPVNSLETIIDGSDAVTGWTDQNIGFGNGRVWKATLPYKAYAMTTSDDKTIWRIDDDIFDGHPEWGDGREIMGRPPDYIYHKDYYMGDQYIQYWDAVGAYFASDGNTVYVRLRNGQSPATRGVRSSPRAGVFTLNGVNNVTLRNFKIRGAFNGVHLTGGASDNVIENCYVVNGKARFFLNNASRTIIRNNEITMNGECCSTYLPGEWGGFNYERAVMTAIYFENKFTVGRSSEDDLGIFMLAGADNEFTGNHIYAGLVGVHLEGGRGTKITGNTIHNMSAQGIWSTEEESADIAHNLIYDNDHNIRISLEFRKTLHIYANRFFQPKLTPEDSGGKHIHLSHVDCESNCTTDAVIWVYHNSFAGGGFALNGGGQGGVPYLNVANNIFSTRDLQESYGPDPVGPVYDERLKIPLWYTNTMPDFIPPPEARDAPDALDLNNLVRDGKVIPPPPGMTAAYYVDGKPDFGAIQGNGAPAGFNFSLSDGGNKSVMRGASVTSSISATRNSGSAQSVDFSVSGLPSGVTGAFSPTSCSPSCSTTLTLNASAAAALGVHPITVTAVGGGLTRTDSFNLTVSAPPVGGTQTFHFEAESGTLTAPMVAANDANASQGQYVWVPEMGGSGNEGSGKASFNFTVTAAGPFRVWARIYTTETGNSFHISLDGGEPAQWHLPVTNNWAWQKVNEDGFELAAGVSHTLALHNREDGTKLDRLVVTNDPGFVPSDDPVSNPPPARPLGFRFR